MQAVVLQRSPQAPGRGGSVHPQAGRDGTPAVPALRWARRDALPECTEYRDTGCGAPCVASLDCPWPRCRYDVPGGIRVLRNVPRDAGIREARARGESVALIGARYGVSRRTVFRVLAGG